MNKSHQTWAQAFQECNESALKHEYEMATTNALFPRKDGKPWENWIGLSEYKRDQVYDACYNTNTKTEVKYEKVSSHSSL